MVITTTFGAVPDEAVPGDADTQIAGNSRRHSLKGSMTCKKLYPSIAGALVCLDCAYASLNCDEELLGAYVARGIDGSGVRASTDETLASQRLSHHHCY